MRLSLPRSVACALVACALGCDEPPPAASLPAAATPPGAVEWPAAPDGMAARASRCADEYRELGVAGLPAREPGQAFSAWYQGPFQTWTDRYNAVRSRCDEVFAELEPTSATAQVVLAAQSYLHERVAADAEPLEAEPQMFVLARYWSLGAACTYQSCGRGADRAWASFCTERARSLPACPPVEDSDEASGSAPEDR